MIYWEKKNQFKFHKSVKGSKSAEYGTVDYLKLEQIEEECLTFQEEKKFFDVKAYVSYINVDNMYYSACSNEKCMKKAIGDKITGMYYSKSL